MGINKYDNQGLRGHQTEGSTAQTNGQVWFVNGNHGSAGNTADTGVGASWDLPFATINYAISRCSNDGGDIIYVAPGHTETIEDTSPLNQSGTVTDELCIDKTGVTIVGMGTGTNRPTITLSGATDATIEIRAADVTLRNLLIVNNLANIIAMVQVNALADGLIIENCEFRDSGASLECVLQINLATAADDITIRGCRFFNTAANDGNTACIFSVGATARLKVYDNIFRGDWQAPVIDLDAAVSTDTEIVDNLFNQLDAVVTSVIDLHGSTTGVVKGNHIHCPAGGSQVPISAAAVLVSDNWWSPNEGVDTQPILGSGGAGGSSLMKHFYVDSGTGVATNDGLSWGTPLSLVDDAIGKCTPNNGDIVHVAAGHAEADLDGSAGQLFDMDVAGITIIGEGVGNNRPTFTFTTDAANALVDLTADDCMLDNLRFACNMASQAQVIKVTGDDCTIKNCEFVEGGQQALTQITLSGDGDADNCKILNNKFLTTTAGPQVSAISIAGDEDGLRVVGNLVRGDFDNGCVDFVSAGDASTDILIKDNILINLQSGDHALQISGVAVTGTIIGNTFITDTRDQSAQPSLCQMFNNKWSKLGTGQVGIDNVDPKTSGIHLFVDNGATGAADTAGHGYSWDEPLATIDAAVNLITASNGDIIHVAPTHAETLATPSAITIDVAGVIIIGHGKGTDKPTITFDTGTDTTWVISAANFYIENFIFINTQDALVVAFPVTAQHATFKNCVFRDAGADNTLEWITAAATGDYLTLIDCINEGTDTAGNNSWVTINGLTNFEMRGCRSNGDFLIANVAVLSVACEDILIKDCQFENLNTVDVCIEGFAATTGWVVNTSCKIITVGQLTWINTPGSLGLYENYGTNNLGEAGLLIGTPSG